MSVRQSKVMTDVSAWHISAWRMSSTQWSSIFVSVPRDLYQAIWGRRTDVRVYVHKSSEIVIGIENLSQEFLFVDQLVQGDSAVIILGNADDDKRPSGHSIQSHHQALSLFYSCSEARPLSNVYCYYVEDRAMLYRVQGEVCLDMECQDPRPHRTLPYGTLMHLKPVL